MTENDFNELGLLYFEGVSNLIKLLKNSDLVKMDDNSKNLYIKNSIGYRQLNKTTFIVGIPPIEKETYNLSALFEPTDKYSDMKYRPIENQKYYYDELSSIFKFSTSENINSIKIKAKLNMETITIEFYKT